LTSNIISIGEAVWDMFPQNRVLGGAPLNVAYHLGCLGLPVILVSRVGDDELGKAARRQVKKLGLSVEGLQVDDELPTGRVLVTFPRDNDPHFEIVAPAAWDNIAVPPTALPGDGFSLVFGTLGQRDPRSRRAIRSLWPRAAYRFYDVNLRPPFTTKELVAESLAAADMAKVNGDELAILGQWFKIAAADKFEIARQLQWVIALMPWWSRKEPLEPGCSLARISLPQRPSRWPWRTPLGLVMPFLLPSLPDLSKKHHGNNA